MNTVLVDGKPSASFDKSLFIALDLNAAPRQSVWRESMLIGVQNEEGDVYRAIGVSGVANFVNAIKKLHTLGFPHSGFSCEAKHGYHVIISAPRPSNS